MTDKAPIIFKCEDSLWQMLAEVGVTGIPGKPFDIRRFDLADDRISRLAWFQEKPNWGSDEAGDPQIISRAYDPLEQEVSFQNKATGEILTFKYNGMEFTDWAPGWCFILLGKRKS